MADLAVAEAVAGNGGDHALAGGRVGAGQRDQGFHGRMGRQLAAPHVLLDRLRQLLDVLACPNCGGRLRLIATLHDPVAIRKLLAHLGMARSGPSPGPPAPGAAP